MDEYSVRQLTEGPEAGKWAVFRRDKQHTRGGSENAARGWANFMNRAAPEPER